MTLTTYLLYAAAVAVLILTSGPTMLMCVSHAVNHGPRRAMASVAGSVTAVLVVMLVSAFFLQSFLVGASNPKAVLFFAAFFPQFLNPAEPIAPQSAILALTFMAFAFTVLTFCALSVSRLAPVLRTCSTVRLINRVSGGLFTFRGGLLLLTRRHT